MPTNEKPNASTEAKEVEFKTMDELLGTDTSVLITPKGDGGNPSIFKRESTDLSFLDNPVPTGTDDDEEEETAESLKLKAEAEEAAAAKAILHKDDLGLEEEEGDEGEEKNKGGRKPALVEATQKLIDKGILQPFNDGSKVEDYTIDDVVELIEMNIAQRESTVAQKAPLDLFSRLDPKLQDVVSYNLNGGKDIGAVLKAVSQSQEITDLDDQKPEHHERIVREYYRSIKFGTDEEIEDEITSLIDRNELDKKAVQFKPKLDAKQAVIMQAKLDKQEADRKIANDKAKVYSDNIYRQLDRPDLNGLALDNKVQSMLYYGLTDSTQYQDRNGNPTNALGHLLEKHQFGADGNPSLVLEALWLLADPQGYRTKVMTLGSNKAAAATLRGLKTAEGEKIAASTTDERKDKAPVARQKPVSRPSGRSIFSRPE